jgi:hypothetical protein
MKNKIIIKIDRLDYKTTTQNGGFFMLPSLNHTTQIDDINEIRTIMIEGEGFEDIVNAMPKSYKWRIANVSDGLTIKKVAYVGFNSFWSNETTGAKNESAIKRRIKIIEKLSKLGL